MPLVDLSRPPPGFNDEPASVTEDDLVPSVPYFDLPAGLMVPMIKVGGQRRIWPSRQTVIFFFSVSHASALISLVDLVVLVFLPAFIKNRKSSFSLFLMSRTVSCRQHPGVLTRTTYIETGVSL